MAFKICLQRAVSNAMSQEPTTRHGGLQNREACRVSPTTTDQRIGPASGSRVSPDR